MPVQAGMLERVPVPVGKLEQVPVQVGMLSQVQVWVGMLERVPVWLEMLKQILVWKEVFGCEQCSGGDGLMEQVPRRDVGAGSLLAGDGGASCSPRILGAGVKSRWAWWRGAPARGDDG